MWQWLEKRREVKNYESQLSDIESKLNTIINLLENNKRDLQELDKKITSVELSIKSIPKEIVVKNVLSI